MKKGLLLLILLLLPLISAIPTVNNYVNDYADLLSSEEEKLLQEQIEQIKTTYSVEIAIVTIKGTEGMEKVMYANKIGQQSGVGTKETDNGVVILWSTEDDKGGAIATGRGIESVLNDAKTGRIGRASLLYMDKGQYFEGFKYILTQFGEEFKKDNSRFTISKEKIAYGSYEMNTKFAVVLIVVLLIIIGFFIATGHGDALFWIFLLGRGGKRKGKDGFGGGDFGGGGSKF